MDTLNQAKNLIGKSQNILLLPSLNSAGDNLGAGLALFFTLKKLGKNVNFVAERIPEKFNFLTDLNSRSSKDFVISINASEKDISGMRYEKNEKNLKIYLASNGREIGEKDISFIRSSPEEKVELKKDFSGQNADLLIVLGADSLEDLGETFSRNSDLFYKTPILNIDNQLSNENFGEVNLIEITSSISESVIELIKLMELEKEGLLDGKIASHLLTGIIWSSQNFRNPKTRPKTFETSAFLIERGADHQEIIQHLYKQKGISQIKLLGRILEKLNFNEKKELYSASLTEEDFQECQASSKDLSFAIEEMKFSFRYLPNLLILWEDHASPPIVKGLLYSPYQDLIQRISENFEGIFRRGGALFLIRERELALAEEKILQVL